MFQYLKRIFCFLFCMLLCTRVFAAPEDGIRDTIQKFLIDEGLDASNFSMSYYNIVTGESYAFHDEAFYPVDKLRFLPTHMYFYEEETKGAFEPETPEEPPFTIGEMSLEDCRYHSIILGEEGISEKMQAQIGTELQYLELVNSRYGQLEPDTLTEEYWEGKELSIRFLMNCIRTVSSRPELFTGLMANYSMVQKADAFANGSISYPIVQIRDEADGYITAVAEVSTPQNFLIAATVKGTGRGDAILGKLNTVICNYILAELGEEPIDEAPTTTTPQQGNSSYYIGEDRLIKDNTLMRWLIISFSVAAVVAVIAMVIWLIWRNNHRHY